MKKHLWPYLNFSKKERFGIITLSCISVLLILLPYWVSRNELPDVQILSRAENELSDAIKEETRIANELGAPHRLFPFDPNTISSAEWKMLGVSASLTKRILNYRNKGGQFRKAEDLRKIWGMPKEQADLLIPYVRLAERTHSFKQEAIVITAIDINTADAEAWKSLPGIGNVLAERIIKHREKAGGYAAPQELQSVFGLRDSVLQALKPYLLVQESTIPKQSLNRAPAYLIELKTGIPTELAKAIVRWRQEKGHFGTFEELLQVPGFKQEFLSTFQKVFMIE